MNKQRKSTLIKMLGEELGAAVWALNNLSGEIAQDIHIQMIDAMMKGFGWEKDMEVIWVEDYYTALNKHFGDFDSWVSTREEVAQQIWLEKLHDVFPIDVIPQYLIDEAWSVTDREKYWPEAPKFYLRIIKWDGQFLTCTKELVII